MTSDSESRRPRILIAEDDALLLYTLERIVEQHGDVVGEAINGKEAVELAGQLRPDVVLLDIAMPVLSGMEALDSIRESFPEIRVIIVSSHSSAAYVEGALNRGAHGYVLKGSAVSQLPKAIDHVLNGRIFRPGARGLPA